jgi:dihydrofolate reductase
MGVLLSLMASCSPKAGPAIVPRPHKKVSQLMAAENRTGSIEGYAIVSEDGMLADAAGIMPDSLKFDADQRFFEQGLDAVDVVVHGRHSEDHLARSHQRHRLILTRQVAAIAPHGSNDGALLWNPAGATFDEALRALGNPGAAVGVIGGTEVFVLFLDRYDTFHLSRAPGVRLPGGRPVFPQVPIRTPEQVLAAHGLAPSPARMLDPERRLMMVSWRRRPVKE